MEKLLNSLSRLGLLFMSSLGLAAPANATSPLLLPRPWLHHRLVKHKDGHLELYDHSTPEGETKSLAARLATELGL